MHTPDFRVPPFQKTGPRWLLVSLVAHSILLASFFRAVVVGEDDPGPFVSYVQLAESDFVKLTVVELPWPAVVAASTAGVVAPVPEPPVASPPLLAVGELVAEAGIADGQPDHNGNGEPIVMGDPGTAVAQVVAGSGRGRLIGPRFASGVLWVRPTHVVYDVDEALDALSLIGGLDEIIASRILAFLDTIPRDSFAIASAPSWTTEIDGQIFGIDGTWVYLGPIKIPTMLLALLPIPQGNIEQARAYEQLQRMRDEVLRQAATMRNRTEVNEYIRQMRERIDREREEKRSRGGRREPVVSRPDTLVS